MDGDEAAGKAFGAGRRQLEILLGWASDLVLVIDATQVITFAGPTVERALGYRPEEMVGRHAPDFVHPDDQTAAAANLAAVLVKPTAPLRLRLRILHRDGSWRHFDSVQRNGLDIPGVGGIVIHGWDISDEMRATEARRQREASYRLLFEANPHPMWVYDLGTLRFLAVNDAAVAQYGFSREEFAAMTIAEIRPAADVPRLLENIAAVREGLDRAGVWRHRRKDGTLLDVEIASHTLDFDGHAAELVLALDVTDRRQAERALRTAEEKYRSLVEQIPAIIYLAAAETGVKLYVSPQIERLLGLSADEWLAAPDLWLQQVHVDDRQRVLDWIAGLQKPGSSPTLEYRLLTQSGAELWFRDEVTGITDATGRVLFRQGVLTDIDARRRAESALERSLDEVRLAERQQRESALLAQREQSRLVSLLAAMRLGILFQDAEGRIEHVNPAFRQLWAIPETLELVGHSAEEALSRSARGLARPDHASRRVLRALDERESGERMEIDLRDGRKLTQSSHPVRDRDGRLLGRLWIFEDVTHERETARHLLYLAERDALTGLYNRHRFEWHLAQMLRAASRSGSRFALLYFDLDEFKYVNDTFGHRAGDTGLVRIASEMSSLLRSADVLARLGGDEFAILAHVRSEQEATALAERVLNAVASIPFRFRSSVLRLTLSGGIALYPEHGESAEDLVAHADAAMYQAKGRGKNACRTYDPRQDPSEAMVHRLEWGRRIDQALADDSFELHFQGIFEPRPGGSLHHLEALVRMRDAASPAGFVMPADFIPFAEKSGQIVAIDRWVIARAVELLAAHSSGPPIAVNVSGRSLDSPILPQFVREQLAALDVDPSRLFIELTETAAVSDVHDAERFIAAARATGCRICLDDFGSGFSSFAYLKFLDVDILKIDGVFIRGLARNRDNQVFVKAMVDVARGLNKQTIAECVEDAETLAMVHTLGVDLAQGYHLHRPSGDGYREAAGVRADVKIG